MKVESVHESSSAIVYFLSLFYLAARSATFYTTLPRVGQLASTVTGRLQYGHSPKSRLNDWRVEGSALSHSHRHDLWKGFEQPSHAISGTQPSRSYM